VLFSNKVTQAWSLVDDLKKIRLLRFFKSRSFQIPFIVVIALLAVADSYLRLGRPEFRLGLPESLTLVEIVTWSIAMLMGSLVFGPLIVSSILRAERALGLFARSAALFLLSGLLLVMCHYYLSNLVPELEDLPVSISSLHDAYEWGVFWVLSVCHWLQLMFIIFWLIIIITLLLVSVTVISFSIFELLLRRIAEYPKGPILGLSAVCGGVAAVLKALGY
jgi:hypothetical protein